MCIRDRYDGSFVVRAFFDGRDPDHVTADAIARRCRAVLEGVVVGFVRSREDYGAYAVALGVLMVTGLFRAGGGWMVLGSIPSDEFRERAPPVFWVGILVGGMACVMTTLASLSGVGLNAASGSSLALLVLGLQFALLPLQQMAQMKLGGEHGYGSNAWTVMTGSLIHN